MTDNSQAARNHNIEVGSDDMPFGPHEEKAIISLVFSSPEFFGSISQYLDPSYFNVPEAKFVYAVIDKFYRKNETMPTRGMVHDTILRLLTVDDDYERILEYINYKADSREVPIIKDVLLDWARDRAYGLVYSEDAISAYESKDYTKLQQLIENAQRIVDVSGSGESFFDGIDEIFDKETEEKLTCGFKPLDKICNEGGPTRGEVFVFMAPTGVGKSVSLVNAGIAAFRKGLKVLYITLELSKHKTKLRFVGAFSRINIKSRFENEDVVRRRIDKERMTYHGDVILYEFPPDEISVDTIYQTIKWLKRVKGWAPDVVIIDYLELMISRNNEYNKDEYKKQKKVSTEIRGLAKNEHVLIITATQTNRNKDDKKKGGGGGGGEAIDLSRIAESYGKSMPTDYIVSINQTSEEYNHGGRIRFYVAKNRNGPKFKTIAARIDYNTMIIEIDEHMRGK